jgi:CheY-like chemotaxis protein
MQAEVQKKDLDLEFKFDLPDGYSADKAVKFESDEGRLKQIVFNLMANAIKFTDSGKITVTSRIQKFENDNGKLYVCVEDTGIGISKEDLEKLFKPFSQVDTGLNRQYSGMGLGLAISNSIVEAMGGVIGCRSIDGKGSAFWFEIPIILKGQADEVELTVKSFDHRVSTQLGQSILLVDDERVNRELGASMIRSLGYNVVCAKDGFEALDLSGKQDFSLILMDIRMPRLDGFSTAEAIRDREGNRPPTPIIALSAHITSEDEERCKSVGINDYLQKPLKIKELNEFLKKWLTAQPSHNRL